MPPKESVKKKKLKNLKEEDKLDLWDEDKSEFALSVIKSNAFDNAREDTPYLKDIYEQFGIWGEVKRRVFYRNYKSILRRHNNAALKDGGRKKGK